VSLFGRREIADLKADKQRLATKVERLEEEKADLAPLAEGRQAVIRQQARHIDTYAAGMERRLDRALKACARYRADLAAQGRAVDFLGQQLLDSVSGHDPRLQALADDVKNGEVTS
jgi:chromosome segregation ATPase